MSAFSSFFCYELRCRRNVICPVLCASKDVNGPTESTNERREERLAAWQPDRHRKADRQSKTVARRSYIRDLAKRGGAAPVNFNYKNI